MIDLDSEPRKLGLILGLGDLNRPPACMTFQHGCVCADCQERARIGLRAPVPPRQPWELKAA